MSVFEVILKIILSKSKKQSIFTHSNMKKIQFISFLVFGLMAMLHTAALGQSAMLMCGEYHKPYNPLTTLTGDSSIVDAFGNQYSSLELQIPTRFLSE